MSLFILFIIFYVMFLLCTSLLSLLVYCLFLTLIYMNIHIGLRGSSISYMIDVLHILLRLLSSLLFILDSLTLNQN